MVRRSSLSCQQKQKQQSLFSCLLFLWVAADLPFTGQSDCEVDPVRDQTRCRERAGVSNISLCGSRCVGCHYKLPTRTKKKQLALYCNNLLCVCVCVLHCIFLSPLPFPLLWWMVLVQTLLLFLYVTLLSQRKNGPGVHHNNAVMDECGCSNYMRTNR